MPGPLGGGFFLTHTVVHSTETKTLNMFSYCTMVVFKGDVVDHCNKKRREISILHTRLTLKWTDQIR